MIPEMRVFPAPAMVIRLLPLVIVPLRVKIPELLVKVLGPPKVELMAQVLLPELVKSPLSTNELPPIVKPPELKVTAPVLASRSLEFVSLAAPVKISASPFAGASPPQLVDVLQSTSAPLPFQVIVAAKPETAPTALSARNGIKPQAVRFERENLFEKFVCIRKNGNFIKNFERLSKRGH